MSDNSDTCLVCGSEAKMTDGRGLNKMYACGRCGEYEVDDDIYLTLRDTLSGKLERIAVLSYAIRRMQRDGRVPQVDPEIVENILQTKLPSISDQRNNLILWLGKNVEGPGHKVSIEPKTHQSITGSLTPEGLGFVLNSLFDEKLVDGTKMSGPGIAHARLTYQGWQYFDELERGIRVSRKAFMAMKFGNPELDKLVDDVYKDAVRQTGFELFRVSERPKAGLIDDNIRVEIRTSRFLIADLTDENAGAYWEAGYAEGLGKPVIYSCRKKKFNDDPTHFDTNHHLTILWDTENPKEVAEALKATIRATLPDEAKLED